MFKPINNALSHRGAHLDEYSRWAIWAIYTEGLRRSGIELKAIQAQKNQVKKQYIEKHVSFYTKYPNLLNRLFIGDLKVLKNVISDD